MLYTAFKVFMKNMDRKIFVARTFNIVQINRYYSLY